MTEAAKHSYGHILRSSALIGAASIIDIALRAIRVKVMALWLGPAGVGSMGLFSSILDLAQSMAGMGVDSSSVRQIAHAAGSGDHARVAVTVGVVRRACRALGIVGAALLALFARQVSTITFGTSEQAPWVAFLSLAVFLRLLNAGQAALLRGTRRIGDLARMEVLGAFIATAASVPLIYFFGTDGIVPSLVAAAGAMTLGSWWYARKAGIRTPVLSPKETRREVGALFRLGFAFMVTALMTMGVAYAVRVLVLHNLGLEAAGHYQSAWTIGGLYVGFILQAMGTDFYPRLTAVADDPRESARMVNEQVLVSLLMAGPGILGTLALAPLVITVFYSSTFDAAVGALRWICLGMSLRVVTWPLGFIVVAKGLQGLFIWIDLACSIVHLCLAWLLVRVLGLEGAGMAFFGLYVFHGLIIYPIARKTIGFRWSRANKQLGLAFLPLVAVVFGGFYVLPRAWATGIGLLAMLIAGAGSLRILSNLVPPESLPTPLRRVLDWMGVLRSA